jgi:hypothetical protein
MLRSIVLIAVVVALSIGARTAHAQDLPDEIRGYKVHDARVLVTNRTEKVSDRKSDAIVRVGDPVVKDKSLSGITLEVTGELETLGHSGTVDFLAFKDFRVNGIAVTIDEYQNAFDFKKKQTLMLPKPIEVFVGIGQTLRGALGEIRDSKPEWEVTGTVFVFGKFKKWGMKFKRVVPVEVRLTIKNPIRNISIIG